MAGSPPRRSTRSAWRREPDPVPRRVQPGGRARPGREWKALSGGVAVVSGQARATPTGTSVAVRDGVSQKDVRLQAQVALADGVSEAGLVARVQRPGTYYYAALERDAGGALSVSIYKVVNNVRTRIGLAGPVGPATGALRFEVVGNSLKLSFNGAPAGGRDRRHARGGWPGGPTGPERDVRRLHDGLTGPAGQGATMFPRGRGGHPAVDSPGLDDQTAQHLLPGEGPGGRLRGPGHLGRRGTAGRRTVL